ncbi:MAG TPA: Na+/H+ antiporter NhaC [Gemmatimonadota bacterium]|nr:Na+/H+ antiporter NhaC [Gemmatimonadota bacterium]
MTADGSAPPPLTLAAALLPIGFMFALIVAAGALGALGTEILIIILLLTATVAGLVARRQGFGWADIQRSTGQKIADVLPALLILLSIGLLIAGWVLSGTIPWLVYWGIRLIDPRFLVLTAFFATALMSLFTGTSWGSAGTIGVALMGTAAALGADLAVTAGAVVSGAYFGDKMSPLSDSTNITAIGAGAPLYHHIRQMMYTAVPSFIVAGVVYLTVGLLDGGAGVVVRPPAAVELLADIDRLFRLDWPVVVPLVVVVFGIARRAPPALAISASALVAAVIGVGGQGFGLQDSLVAVVGGFRAEMIPGLAADAGTGPGTQFLQLVERGGLYSMTYPLVVVIAAFLLAGAMDVSGALDLLIHRLLGAVRSVFGLIAATMAAGATMIALISHGGVTALVIGGLFQPAYEERDLAPENLSRSLEDSVTLTEPLMPWTVSAVFMAVTLGVPTLSYAPWAVFCYGGPFFSLLIAALYRRTRFGIRRRTSEDPAGYVPSNAL